MSSAYYFDPDKKDFVFPRESYPTGNYFRYGLNTGAWHRSKSLNRLCSEQRLLTIWFANKNSHWRKLSICPTFWYWIKHNDSRQEAYRKALLTQIDGKPGKQGINVDSRTTWIAKEN